MTTLIKGAFVYMGAGFSKLDVLITDGKINTLGTSISTNGVDAVFFAQDKYLIPGFVDVHIHLREPGFSYKETIRTGTLAAAKGGYTGVCPMPNINPVPDSVENIGIELDLIKKDAVINTYPFAAITKGRKGRGELVDFDALKELAVGFSDDGTGVQDEQDMRLAMEQCAKIGKVISAHCEVNDLLHGGYIHDGEYCKAHGHKGICSASEYEQIERDCKLAEETGVRYHVCHISTKESVDIIRKAKARGVNVTCETGPHYLTMCDKDLQEDGRFKMNPPLRSEEDKQALLQGILDGTIDVIATDHAPHSKEEKEKKITDAPSGIIGLETALTTCYKTLVKEEKLDILQVFCKFSRNPAKIYEINAGALAICRTADLVIFDPKKEWIYNKSQSKSFNSPLKDQKITGDVVMTICHGKIVYENL